MVTKVQARTVANKLGIDLNVVDIDEFKYALKVELEHGHVGGSKTNVTNNNLLKTGKIALAHYLEFPDYYKRLKRMEEQAHRYWKGKKKPSVLL